MAQVLPTKRRLNPYDLRRLFNEGYYIKRLTSQEFTAKSVRCKAVHPGNPNIGPRIPIGSISQALQLLDANDDLVAEFHRYIRPEGTIGASGQNDPKRIAINNVRFHQEQPGNPQPRCKAGNQPDSKQTWLSFASNLCHHVLLLAKSASRIKNPIVE